MRYLLLVAGLSPGLLGGCHPAAPAPNPRGDSTDCALGDRIDTSRWRPVEVGPFTFRLPTDYVPQEVRSVDSRVDAWAAPGGRRVDSDYGFYGGDLSRRPNSPMREPIVYCEANVSEAAPQVALYRDSDRKYVVGLFWPRPGGRSIISGPDGRTSPEALQLTAEADSAEKVGELLAIIRSVRPR